MSIFTPVIFLFLAMLIQDFLQLTPALFSIFYHFALAKTSKNKADDLAISFILGAETFTAILVLVIFHLTSLLYFNFSDFSTRILPFILAGLFTFLAIFVLFIYFRSSSSTTLFLPRPLSRGLLTRAKLAKTRGDAFLLGFFAGVGELFLTLPLFFILALATINLTAFPAAPPLIAYVAISTIPLFIIRHFYRTGHNLAEITRRRIKFKPLFRLVLFIGFLLLATLNLIEGIY